MTTGMRPVVSALLDSLLERSQREGGIDIDAFGDAVTPVGLSPAEIEILINAYEDRGGVLHAPSGGGHAERLKVVLVAARELAPKLGRPAKPSEIAEYTKMDVVLVRAALAVGRVMGR